MAERRLRAQGCLATFSVALAVAALLGMAGGSLLTDRFVLSQWLWWVPWPLWCLLALPGAIVAMSRQASGKGWGNALVVLAFAGMIALGVATSVRVRTAQRGPGELALLHWNAGWPDTPASWGPSEALLTRQADVVLVSNPYRLFNDGRQETWQRDGYDVVIPGTFAVCSRVPIVEARTVYAGRDTGAALVVLDATATLGRVVRLLVIDLPSDPQLPRLPIVRRFRDVLVERGVDDVDLIVGDCNITRGSASLAELAPGLRHAWDDAGYGWSGSWPRGLPLFHLDHAFVAPWLEATSYRLIDAGSDRGGHLVQELRIRRKAG